MKKIIINAVTFVLTFSLVECTTIKRMFDKDNVLSNRKVKRNTRFTKKVVNEIFKKKNNVFSISTTYGIYATVWTYDEQSIEVYKILNSKIIDVKKYNCSDNHLIYQFSNDKFDTFECLELDGDGMYYKIRNEVLINNGIPVNINCFENLELDSPFFRKIAKDIKNYELNKW